MTAWNTIDDRYSIFPLYRNEASFLAFAPFSEHFQYDSVEYYRGYILQVCPLYSNEATFLDFASFESIFSMTVWNTIDDTYSISPLYRNEATFLAFAPFSEHFQYDSVEYYR